ncbi:MAG: DHH family phosphoesterase [SAR324 cluster bacterium]|nr:DHH family phosphoesterase [SAR324 cluster bacterium]
MFPVIKSRTFDPEALESLKKYNLSPIQSRILAARIQDYSGPIASLLNPTLKILASPDLLKNCAFAAERMARAIRDQKRIGLLFDYDVDGVTSGTLSSMILTKNMGYPSSLLSIWIGHRLTEGYGLSDGLVERILAHPEPPQWIITADCGSSDEPRIARLRQAGIQVIVTDHHAIPQQGVPQSAFATVNPQQEDCLYPDKTIAGCMVMFLLFCQIRNELITLGSLNADAPKLTGYLDFVSLGTMADAVSMCTPVNRSVVLAGLKQINQLQRPCWQSLKNRLKPEEPFMPEDLGFLIGPRINARGRMADPFAAYRFLTAPDLNDANHFLDILENDNKDRRYTEKSMLSVAKKQAVAALEKHTHSLCVFHPGFHLGVQGIVASRLLELYGRPTVVLSPMKDNLLSASVRSIPGVHVKNALQWIEEESPGFFYKFGGHRGAAGFSLESANLELFSEKFEMAVRRQMTQPPEPMIWTDGKLSHAQINFATLNELQQLQPFGREFESPLFEGEFVVESLYPVGNPKVHLSLLLSGSSFRFKAIWFNALEHEHDPVHCQSGDAINCVFEMAKNVYLRKEHLQLRIKTLSSINNVSFTS